MTANNRLRLLKLSGRGGALCVCLVALLAGCSKAPPPRQPVHVRPEVQLVQPERKTITRITGQPGFIEAWQQTALYPLKVSGYIAPWTPEGTPRPKGDFRLTKEGVGDGRPDIGDPIKEGEILAHINVPDLEAEYREKQAEEAFDVVQIQVARELVHVAEENVNSAHAQVAEARANIGRYQADVERWQSEVTRLGSLTDSQVINQQILSEARKQLKSSTAAREAAQATEVAARAMEAARKADLAKANVDVKAAEARARVTSEAVQRLAAMVGYTDIRAPYNGVIVARNVVTGDFVQPNVGDATGYRSLQERGTARNTPLYVVAQTDIVRIFLDVPEMEASGVGPGSPATVRIQAVDTEEIKATVTRTSGELQNVTRTLRVEIDIKNPGGRIKPGMYAYGQVQVQRPNVWTIPLKCITMIGNQNCCYLCEDGKAVQTPIQRGIDDGKRVEVLMKRVKGKWVPVDGKEQVIAGDLSELADGQEVRVEKGNKE